MAVPRIRFGAALLLALLTALPVSSPGQLVLGQYEDEAPLQSWNTFGMAVAPSLGRGQTGLALAENCSAALANPALLPSLSKFSVCLNGSYSYTSLFRYSVVNTGVLTTAKNPAVALYTLDFAGISSGFNGWAIALTACLIESYDRPSVEARSDFQGFPEYKISFDQTGYLRNFNLAVARTIGRSIQAGLGFNFVRGELHRQVIDRDYHDDITISQLVDQKFSGFYLNAGLLVRLSERLDMACVFRTSYNKKSESRSGFRYQAPRGGTDISIEAASSDTCRQPWAAGVGLRYGVSAKLQLLGDLIFFPWSNYKAEFFGETDRRDFRDTFKAGVGAEYFLGFRLFGHDANVPLRLGIFYDRQPMRHPISAYTNISFGLGIRWRMMIFDIGGVFGRESGSGHSLETLRIASSLGIRL